MTLPAGVQPIRIDRVPSTEAERKAVQAACQKAARRHVGSSLAKTLAVQLYNDAIAEASRQVREAPRTSFIVKPEASVVAPPAAATEPSIPGNMRRSASGLLVPQ